MNCFIQKGAFTGATQDHRGKLGQASGVFDPADEISEMALLQAKLRVLQEREIDKVGERTLVSRCTVIATTNRDMIQRVEDNQFREDSTFV